MSFLAEFVEFIWKRKNLWLMPVFLLILVFGGLIVFLEGSVVAPLIYTMF
jgi:hypothetical protein